MTGDVVNDFCIQAATVNGSGSQSSNLVITKALFHMGIPVAAKNVFPSNIEGQPTWYDIRVTPQGYQARKRTVDVLIAMNPATWEQDVANVRPGGAIIHEATLPHFGAAARDDVSWYPVPFARLAREKLEAKPDLRKYLQNMIYVGVLAELIGLDPAAVEQAVRDQFRTKPKAADLNLAAIRIGVDYTRATLAKSDPFRVEPMDGTRGLVLLDGNRAAALGGLMAGCTVLAWYPITPSSSLCEAFIEHAERFRTDPETGEKRYAAIQAEDELAAIGIVLGAQWAGARAMTATSGPGISLMAELTGLGYYAEVPAVIFDIQRVGPSTGLPTRTMQGDVGFVHALSHGDTRHPVLLPGTVVEVYEDAQRAFDLADRLQTPVFVLSDLDLGMNQWMTPPLAYPEGGIDRGKVLDAQALDQVAKWARYRDVDGDGIPYRTLPGTPNPRAGYMTRGSGHDQDALYTEDPDVYRANMDRLRRKIEGARTLLPAPVIEETGCHAAICAYGTTHHAVVEARHQLAEHGIATDYLRIRGLPLHPAVAAFIARHERVYVAEQNRDGQVEALLRQELPGELADRLRSVRHFNGVPIDAEAISEPVLAGELAAGAHAVRDDVAISRSVA
ncbi:MAG: 2-oxoacid:acceptor oxidoreductase subunit alpha [Candidatus Dormibacteria bacterium]|jgi:2-oxoglutarate ferredoxin oxidoreductase subunit alpha